MGMASAVKQSINLRSSSTSIVVLTLFLFLNSPIFAADLCITPDVLEGFARAKLVFSGKILNVTQCRNIVNLLTGGIPSSILRWKGTGPEQFSVVWHSSMLGCSYFPVGEIGENYLVYAEPLTTAQFGNQSLAEVSVLNRTSKLPLRRELDQTISDIFAPPVSVDSKPTINRRDATKDIKVLQVLTQCRCVSSDSGPACIDVTLSSVYPMPADIGSSSRSHCCECLRQNFKPF